MVTPVSRALAGLGLVYRPIREVGWGKESQATHLVPCSLSAGSSQTGGACTKGHGSCWVALWAQPARPRF